MTILYVLLALVAVLLIGAYLRPRFVKVQRAQVIHAPASAIYPHIVSLEAFSHWSPWAGRDPNMDIRFSGPDQGVGNVMEWTSEVRNVGSGRQEITEAVENQKVKTALDFGAMGTAEAWWLLEEAGDQTTITWHLNADMGTSPIGRWMGMMMDKWVGGDYETGLSALKAKVEAG